MLLFLFLPGLTQAQIFRCQEKGETWFSQIPCTDGSEAVVVEDQPLFSEAINESVLQPRTPLETGNPARTQAENLQEFVSTLHRQRIEQLQQIDEEISALAARLDDTGDAPEDGEQRKLLAAQLAEMQTSRSSIEEQYDSLITEAERRVVALSARSGKAEETIN